MENIEYVIYCRKSTDESSESQKQSIPDQIKTCVEYADRESLSIKEKPKDFSLFESESEIYKEDNNEKDIVNIRTYKDTRHLYIIKEQETGKIPGKRPKWNHLIKMIKNGKIKGLISYSPDRQARNMLEGGELINCVDEDQVTLKYTNFHFENNASGKMMLGIWFVFSKQYSDKLSEDISRGNKSKIRGGKAIGRHKPGYIINNEGYHQPHTEYFPLIQEAFDKKLDGVPESIIREFLDANGYVREFKKAQDIRPISKTALNAIFRDEFYYGININGDTVTDLRETNKYYKPTITEEQFQILQDRYYKNPIVVLKSRTKDIYDCIKTFDSDFLITEDNYSFTFSLPNKKRYFDKIDNSNKEGERIELKDIVKTNQIIYRSANKNSKFYNLSISQAEIDTLIIKALDKFKVGEKEFQEYIKFSHSRLDDITKTSKEKIASKNLEAGRLKNERKKYIKDNMSFKKDREENEIYLDVKNDYDKKISLLRKEVESLDEGERNEIVELEIFVDILNQASSYYKRANYVQKRKIAKILFLNIKIDHKKRLHIQVKPELETLLSSCWWSKQTNR